MKNHYSKKEVRQKLIDFYMWTEDQCGFGTTIEESTEIVDMYLNQLTDSGE